MESKKFVVSLVAVLAIAIFFAASASAFGTIQSVKVSGFEVRTPNGANVPVSIEAGQTVPVEIFFNANQDAKDVRIKVGTSGSSGYLAVSDRFDVLENNSYSRVVHITVPTKLDNPGEKATLLVDIESENNGVIPRATVALTFQREAYEVDFLDVEIEGEAVAGTVLPISVILKNRGSHSADDTFVRAKIPALNLEERAYFGDLSQVDKADPDKEDAAERTLFLRIPGNVKAGTYTLEVEAYNDDISESVSKKISVADASGESMVISSTTSKTFNVDEKEEYSVTLVNSGNKVKVYNLIAESPSEDLSVTVSEPVVVIPAGSSKTVAVEAKASETGSYAFGISILTDGTLVKKENFTAKIEGKKAVEGNLTVVLTVILAIVFVVLLVVLIVLLTRKPEKSKELGESYY